MGLERPVARIAGGRDARYLPLCSRDVAPQRRRGIGGARCRIGQPGNGARVAQRRDLAIVSVENLMQRMSGDQQRKVGETDRRGSTRGGAEEDDECQRGRSSRAVRHGNFTWYENWTPFVPVSGGSCVSGLRLMMSMPMGAGCCSANSVGPCAVKAVTRNPVEGFGCASSVMLCVLRITEGLREDCVDVFSERFDRADADARLDVARDSDLVESERSRERR